MNGFSACAPILLSTNSRYTKVTSTQSTLMAAHPTRVRVVTALNATALYCLFSHTVTFTAVNITHRYCSRLLFFTQSTNLHRLVRSARGLSIGHIAQSS